MIMGCITRLRHRIGKWIWKENDWTKAVEDIENAVYQLRSEKQTECIITWQFKFLRPPNKFTCHIKLDN